MSNDNLKLWNSVSSTPGKFVKDGQKGLSSINSQYYILKATEAFGPIGIGWGYSVEERTITEGATIKHKDGDYTITQMTLRIKFWYKLKGDRGEFEQYGHTPLVMKTKYGAMLDDDPEKKSLTDAIKKSLTFLGVCADIHLGQFDDQLYIKNKILEEGIKADIEKEEKDNILKEEISAYMKKCLALYEHIPTIPAVNQQFKKDTAHINREFARLGANSSKHTNAISEAANKQSEIIKGEK